MIRDIVVPSTFEQRFRSLLGDEYEIFIRSIRQPREHFVRINTLKTTLQTGLARLHNWDISASPLPWYKAGFRISGNQAQLPFTPEYSLGYFYIQEGGSMLPPIALNPQPNHLVLDLCAAPGSKTTQLAQMMENQGTIIANDRSFRRLTGLGHNIQTCGIINTIVLCEDGRHLSTRIPLQFDRVLIDAPCTASGHLRSKPQRYHTPDPQRIKGLQTLQKGLLTSGFRLLKPEGLLVYSTCSLHPEENEAVIHHLISHNPQAEIIQPSIPEIKSHSGITQWSKKHYNSAIQKCLRVYPHDNNTDGFFIALLRKES
ncbi:MAG: RsmB/NOP family class I SAM-dependent RNA methyltransferase [Candidatus Thorarchaeota archaeon]